MIPLRLSVKNFMCYRDQAPELDLEGVHVACLCGDNGHGKTALLDAITWALWGEARGTGMDSPNQEELIYQGQQDMAVELDFLSRGQRYRVSRRHARSARSRQGSTDLVLQLETGDGYRVIASTVRDVQSRLKDIVHMDYPTFINTAFILQGRADMFTRSSPTKRKEVLAEVLDLSYYQTLEERARARSRKAQEETRDADGAIALRQEEIARRPQYETDLAAVSVDLARISPEVVGRRQDVAELRASVESLRGRRADLDALDAGLTNLRGDMANLERQAGIHEEQVAQYASLLEKGEEIRESFGLLQSTRTEQERLDQAFAKKNAIDLEIARLQQEIAVQRERLSVEATQLRTRIAQELEPRVKSLPEIETALTGIGREQASLEDRDAALVGLRSQAEEAAARVRYLDDANTRLTADMVDTRKKFDMLEQGAETICPLCRQPLGDEGQGHLRREYEDQGRESRRQFDANAAEKAQVQWRLNELAAQAATMESAIRADRRQLESRLANLERDKAESVAAGSELEEASNERQRIEAVIASEEFGHEERRSLTELDADVAALAYDATLHGDTRQRIRDLEPYADLHRRLLDADTALPTTRESLASARQMLELRRKEVADGDARVAAMGTELAELPALEERLDREAKVLGSLEEQERNALVRKGVLEKDLQRIDGLQGEVRDYESKRRRLADQKAVFDELAAAFGRNGIQALIIETAIPQLESDANELLGRLTENRMSLRLQLQEGRLVRGVRQEELGIRIADEVGTRSYETFSGGEAFRINFALRIALSKLLASRSGAPLPILFIDEGFGSQDSVGQERLTEAIQSIQDDFEKIIVITHIDSVKEAFPVRIEVAKTELGSTFQVV